MMRRRWIGLALTACLAGCSSGEDAQSVNLATFEAVRNVIRQGTAPAAEPGPQVTRAVLDTLDGEFLQAEVESSGSQAFLFVSLDRRDAAAGGGRVVVWRTENDVTLTVRDGVLIATRGLGGDVISTDVSAIRQALRGRSDGNGARRLVISGLDFATIPLDFACEITNLGRETIVIVERRHVTDHLRETCTLTTAGAGPASGVIQNDYWIDSGGPTMWQSRQWAGPNVGYVQLRQLTP